MVSQLEVVREEYKLVSQLEVIREEVEDTLSSRQEYPQSHTTTVTVKIHRY